MLERQIGIAEGVGGSAIGEVYGFGSSYASECRCRLNACVCYRLARMHAHESLYRIFRPVVAGSVVYPLVHSSFESR